MYKQYNQSQALGYKASSMTAKTVLMIYQSYIGVKYRSMRHITTWVTIMMVTLIIGTIDGSVSGVFATYS